MTMKISDLLPNGKWTITQANQTHLDRYITDNTAKTHNYCEAVDLSEDNNSFGEVKAPCSLNTVETNRSANRVVLQSSEKVLFANGVKDFFCIMLLHMNDNNFHDLNYDTSPEQSFTKGKTIYYEGSKVDHDDKRTDNHHVHFQCGRGTFSHVKKGDSGFYELFTKGSPLSISDLFLGDFNKIGNHRRLKWSSDFSQTNAYLETTKGPINIRTSPQGSWIQTVPKGKSINILSFFKKDYSGYMNGNDNYEWAKVSFRADNGVTYNGFAQLDTRYYSLFGGKYSHIYFTPYYQGVYLRTGLPYKSGNTIVKVEAGKRYLPASKVTKVPVIEFIKGLQADGYCYAKVKYESKEYYVQLDLKRCYSLLSS